MKKFASIAFALMVLVTLTACGSTPTADLDPTPEPVQATSYKNLTVEAAQALAEKNGVPFRVVEQDGQPLPATMDYRIGRINASTQDNIVISYQVEGQEEPAALYDANSWKTIIAESCSSFFDGCNNCRRAGNTDVAACTKKACMEYQEPKCLDAETTETKTEPIE